MTRRLYTAALWLVLPLALLHLLLRSRKQKDYLLHWGERFALYPPANHATRSTIWIHAVSVGETRAAQPLVNVLRKQYPEHRILLTHTTPTGRQTGIDLFGDSIERCYLPYDFPGAVSRFLDHVKPTFGLIMETELWPNLVAICNQRRIPLLLVNGRLSEKSARRYARFDRLTRDALDQLSGVAAQNDSDARRFTLLGATNVAVLGNLKFDISPPATQLTLGAQFKERLGTRSVLLCASTRESEEALILDAWKQSPIPDTLLALVPRHPQRMEEVANLILQRGLTMQRRSDERPVALETQVWLGDSMGEMFAYYAACDVAFVGGSLVELGGQNLIEPCAVGKPVLIGPSTFNFARAAEDAIAAGACQRINDAKELMQSAAALLGNSNQSTARRENAGHKALTFATAHRGATARTMGWIEGKLNQAMR